MMKIINPILVISLILILYGCGSVPNNERLISKDIRTEMSPAAVSNENNFTDIGNSFDINTSTLNFSKKTPKENALNTVSIVMAGDILLHTPVEEAARDENGNYNFDFLFTNTKDLISTADIAIVNQEVIIGGKELGISGYPCFNAPTQIGDALVDAGFDVICHATNHSLDKGKQGVINCISYWNTAHPSVSVIGLNNSEEEYLNIDIFEKNGISIAILNYTYGTNGINPPSDMPHVLDLLEKDKIVKDLKYAEENADFTIVCPHWGTEYNLGIDQSQQKWAAIFRENGADLVIGTHPHVIEPIVLFEDDSPEISNNHGDGDMLVYYSLGNYVNWTSSSGNGIANRMVGGLAQVTIGYDDNNEVVIQSHGVTPIVCHLEKGYQGISIYPLSEYNVELAQNNAIRSQDPAFSLEYCINLYDEVWGEH